MVLDNSKLMLDYPVFSVKDISNAIKNTVESNFSMVKVQGEISGLKIHSSGHMYYALKDSSALIDAVSWRGSKLGIEPKEGQEVIATGKITTFGARSKYQMVVSEITATGQGELYQLFLKRKADLEKEGLFSLPKKEIPKFPKTIAVITSPTGAVIHDILHRIRERYPTHIQLYPVAVQGDAAKGQIANALQAIENGTQKPELLIIARGGGSLEDLWAFNEEPVVRALASCSIPVISAIGHETDVTLCDFVADRRAPTPTGAAEIATPDRLKLFETITAIYHRYQYWIIKFLKEKILQLRLYSKTLPTPTRMINEAEQKLDYTAEALNVKFRELFIQKRSELKQIHLPSPLDKIALLEQKLDFAFTGLRRATHNKLHEQSNTFNNLVQRLDESSIQKTLKRGFCLIEKDKKIVRSAQECDGSELTAHFHDGERKFRV